MGEDFQFFTADDLFVVLQQWRGMLFYIQSNDPSRQEVMRLQLQKIREILIFLFGTKFDSVMKRNISIPKRQVFAKYVDTYLSACEKDYLYLVNALRVDDDSENIGNTFLQSAAAHLPDFPINLLTCVLFNDHKIVARFNVPNTVEFDPDTYSMLSVFERVEYDEVTNDKDSFNSAFVGSPENSTMKHKNGFLRIERTPVACALSSTRCSFKSPFVLLAVTQNAKMQQETQDNIRGFLKSVTDDLMNASFPEREPKPVEILDDLLHYVVINRTSGDVWELPEDLTIRMFRDRLGLSESDAKTEMQKVKSHLSAYGMSAMVRGYTMMMRGEFKYQFCYEMRFEDSEGNVMKPTQVFSPPPFNDDTGINYKLISDTIFQTDENITCIELFSVYRGKIQAKAAMAANQQLFDMYKHGKKTK